MRKKRASDKSSAASKETASSVNFTPPPGLEMPLFKDSVLLRTPALNKERLLTSLTRGGVKLRRLTIFEGGLFFIVDKKDASQTFAICDKLCYNITVCGESGIKRLLTSALKRIGIFAGIGVFALTLAFSTRFIWKIEVNGNSRVDTVLIERLLRDNNVRVGGKKQADLKNLIAAINAMDGIEDSTAQFDGTTLKITVVESTVFEPPADAESDNLVSGYDAVVTRVVVEKGTAAVGVGQAVTKGEVLIKGERTTQAGEVVTERAAGSVYGIVSYAEHYTVSVIRETKVYGKKKRKTSLNLFGLRIGKAEAPEGSETVTTASKLGPLPVKVTTVTYRSVETITEEVPLETLKDECVAAAKLKYGVVEGETVCNVERLSENVYRVNVYVSGEKRLT